MLKIKDSAEILNNNMKLSSDLNILIRQLSYFIKDKEMLQQKIFGNFLDRFEEAYEQHFFDIFDSLTGGIKISDVDWILGEEKLIKFLGRKNKNGQYLYVLPTNDGYLLRGSETYYHYLSNVPYDYFKLIDKNIFIDGLKSTQNFLTEFIQYINSENSLTLKISLAFLDNLRNQILILLNAKFLVENDFKHGKYYVNFDSKLFKAIELFYSYYEKLFNFKHFILQPEDLVVILDILNSEIKALIPKLKNLDNNKVRKLTRVFRELDSIWEIFISLKYFFESENSLDVDNISEFCGIAYGGIEIPLVAHLFKEKNEISFLFQNSHYSTQEVEVKRFRDSRRNDSKSILLMDDNILTGRAMKNAAQKLSYRKYSVQFFHVRRLGLNRLSQVIQENSMNELQRYLTGIYKGGIFPAPYSKIKFGTNIAKQYLDELQIFTLSGDEILRLLYKNGLFSEESEVKVVRGNLYE